MSIFQSFFQQTLSAFMTLFPVVNPIGIAFIINSFFSSLSKEQRYVSTKTLVYYSFFLCVVCLLLGQLILMIFHLSIPIIQVGGGFLICKTALNLLADKPETKDKPEQDLAAGSYIKNKLFYPLTFPIVIDAGTISVIFALAASSFSKEIETTIVNFSSIFVAIILCCVMLYVFTHQAFNITKRIGTSGAQVINKMCAFFTFCVGLNVIYEGIIALIELHTK